MKKQYNNKINILKKLFVKLCRLFNYELIDQSSFYSPTKEKMLNLNLSTLGKKSIVLPLGETKITRNVKKLTVIFRSCTKVNMLTQSKKRLFDKNKNEYTFRSLNSIITSLKNAQNKFPNIIFNLIVIDHNSEKNDLDIIKKQLERSSFNNHIISLNLDKYLSNIDNTNAKKENVTDNQKSNMANINESLLYAKEKCDDLIYFVEDDYLHKENAIEEMICTYERISSQLNSELILCPSDYPYLYTKVEPTGIFLGSKYHWRLVSETLCTFLTSSKIIEKYWDKYVSMCKFEHYPFEQPLHDIYKLEYCLSPIPSLALHCTNINSIFGVSPNMDWKKIWTDNENYK